MARSSMGTAAITCLLIASLREVCGTSGQWQQTPHVFCGLAPHPAANVTWGVTIQDCASVCLAAENCSAFAFTDPIWTGSPGCSLTEACSDPCRAGDCANWDLWVCKGGSSARDCGPIPSPLQVSPVLGSHMVLQRDVPNAIWGTITRGSTVVVRVSDGKGPSVNVSTVATSNDTCVLASRSKFVASTHLILLPFVNVSLKYFSLVVTMQVFSRHSCTTSFV